MSELIITEKENIVVIANAIRNKTGTTGEMTLNQMANSINGIETDPVLQTKTVTPTTSTQTITADNGYDGLDTVMVNAVPTETKTITANGTYTPTIGKFFSSVDVDVASSGGSGGGSSGTVETCNVTLSYPAKYNLVYTCVENGEVCCKSFYISNFEMNPTYFKMFGIDLSKIVKGSFLLCGLSTNMDKSINVTTNGDVEIYSSYNNGIQSSNTVGIMFKINGDCTITITE